MNEIDLNKLENHIDEPIKKCVVGMALLGFKPLMSCCGFNYKGEKVPKKHLKKAYMYLSYPDLVKDLLGTRLIQVSTLSGWTINPLKGGNFLDFYANTWDKEHPWSEVDCPHFHETFVLGISCLEKSLIDFKGDFKQSAIIKDGNSFYKENVSKFWQYEPTQDWEVTPEIFDSL